MRPTVLAGSYPVPTSREVDAWLLNTFNRADAGGSTLHRDGYPLLYRVQAPTGVRWLRIYSATLAFRARLSAQVRAIAHLHELGAPVVRPLAGRAGESINELRVGTECRLAVMFANAPGRIIDRTRPCDIEAFGAALGRFHREASGQSDRGLHDIDAEYLIEGPLQRLRSHKAAKRAIDDLVPLAAELVARLGGRLPLGLCHGDAHLGNASVAEHGATVFDFDELGRGPLAYDLACVWRKCQLDQPNSSVRTREWEWFLRGYASQRPVSADERRALPALAAARAIWTMAMPTESRGLWGEDWLADPDYFAAHQAMIRQLADEPIA